MIACLSALALAAAASGTPAPAAPAASSAPAPVAVSAPAADVALPPAAPDSQAVGATYGTIAGSGFGYFRSYPSGWGWHAAGIGWGQGERAFWNVGGALTKQIDRRPWGTLYWLLGAGAGLDLFTGVSGGLTPTTAVQYNLTPGLGFTWGPIVLELGMSAYYNGGGFGYGPGFGSGLVWWF